jgi:hypothetical protein
LSRVPVYGRNEREEPTLVGTCLPPPPWLQSDVFECGHLDGRPDLRNLMSRWKTSERKRRRVAYKVVVIGGEQAILLEDDQEPRHLPG